MRWAKQESSLYLTPGAALEGGPALREGGQVVGPLNQSVNAWGLSPEWGGMEYLWEGLECPGKGGSGELLSANSQQLASAGR